MKSSILMDSLMVYAVNLATGRIISDDPLQGIDIDKEFKLIGQKKSNLSASLRRLVIRRYEMGG